jgi:hypothetical protein
MIYPTLSVYNEPAASTGITEQHANPLLDRGRDALAEVTASWYEMATGTTPGSASETERVWESASATETAAGMATGTASGAVTRSSRQVTASAMRPTPVRSARPWEAQPGGAEPFPVARTSDTAGSRSPPRTQPLPQGDR